MKFKTVWPEGIVEAHTLQSFEKARRMKLSIQRYDMLWEDTFVHSVQECIGAMGETSNISSIVFGGDANRPTHLWCNTEPEIEVSDAIDLLHGGMITVAVLDGVISPTIYQDHVFQLVFKILFLSPEGRLVGTWKDGQPVRNGEIFFHVI